jgi:hypothetical protein
MPDLDPEIRDLLARLLTVDPARRIRIPAARAGLPDDYRLPSPLPLPHVARPIAPGADDEVLIDIVEQIGFASRADVIGQLAAEGCNIIKFFFHMLSQPFDCASIPWPADHPFIRPVDPDFVCDGLPVMSEQEDSIRSLGIGLVELMAAVQRHLDGTYFAVRQPGKGQSLKSGTTERQFQWRAVYVTLFAAQKKWDKWKSENLRKQWFIFWAGPGNSGL